MKSTLAACIRFTKCTATEIQCKERKFLYSKDHHSVDSRFVESLIDFPVSSKNFLHCFSHHSRFVENEKTSVPVSSKM